MRVLPDENLILALALISAGLIISFGMKYESSVFPKLEPYMRDFGILAGMVFLLGAGFSAMVAGPPIDTYNLITANTITFNTINQATASGNIVTNALSVNIIAPIISSPLPVAYTITNGGNFLNNNAIAFEVFVSNILPTAAGATFGVYMQQGFSSAVPQTGLAFNDVYDANSVLGTAGSIGQSYAFWVPFGYNVLFEKTSTINPNAVMIQIG